MLSCRLLFTFKLVARLWIYIYRYFQNKQVTLETIDDFILSNADGNESRFLCAICHVVIKRRNHLRQHIKTIHLKVRNHVCSFCDAAFTKTSDRIKHEKRCKNRPQGQWFICCFNQIRIICSFGEKWLRELVFCACLKRHFKFRYFKEKCCCMEHVMVFS